MREPGESAAPKPPAGPSRWLLFALAWVFFGVGFVGAVLPVLPTTPFMLLALWAFSRSSPRFHAWLYNHPVFGPKLVAWHEHRVIPRRVKVIALLTMAASLAYLIVSDAPWWVPIAAGSLMAVGAFVILRSPSEPAPEPAPES